MENVVTYNDLEVIIKKILFFWQKKLGVEIINTSRDLEKESLKYKNPNKTNMGWKFETHTMILRSLESTDLLAK